MLMTFDFSLTESDFLSTDFRPCDAHDLDSDKVQRTANRFSIGRDGTQSTNFISRLPEQSDQAKMTQIPCDSLNFEPFAVEFVTHMRVPSNDPGNCGTEITLGSPETTLWRRWTDQQSHRKADPFWPTQSWLRRSSQCIDRAHRLFMGPIVAVMDSHFRAMAGDEWNLDCHCWIGMSFDCFKELKLKRLMSLVRVVPLGDIAPWCYSTASCLAIACIQPLCSEAFFNRLYAICENRKT